MTDRKITLPGFRVAGEPHALVLEHDDAPAEVVEAHAALVEARAEVQSADRAETLARRAAREKSTRAPGDDLDAEIRAATAGETKRARAARHAAMRAARAFVAALDEHDTALRVLGARIALEHHARRVDFLVEAARHRLPSGVAPNVPPHRLTPPNGGVVAINANPLEHADRVNTQALAEIAGTRLDLVEVVGDWGGRILTTPRRAAMLAGQTRAHGQTWTLADDTTDEEG